MREAVVFNGTNALDFQDIRNNVIRIPEVFHAVREAQEIWDALNHSPFDLTNFLGSEDHVFLSQIRLKKFAGAVVQTGLWKRFLRYNPMPEFLIGAINGDSPMKVALQQMSFVEMVAESEALPKDLSGAADPSSPLLAGVRLDEYAVFQKLSNEKFNRIHFETFDVQKMAEALASSHGVGQFIFVGPGAWKNPLAGATISESIALDPHLSWFWETAKGGANEKGHGPGPGRRLAIAN